MNVYVSFDGDGIGQKVGRARLADDVEAVRRISQSIDQGNEIWRSFALSTGGSVVELGGDEGALEIPADRISELPAIRDQYAGKVGATVSVGVGMKLGESSKALLAAKLKGKDQIVFFSDECDDLIEQVQKNPQSEAAKIADEYLNKAAPAMNPGAFEGAHRPSAATVDKPVQTQGDTSEMDALNGVLGDENAPAPAEQTHAASDFEKQLHDEAWKGEEEDMAQDGQKQQRLEQVKAQLVQALQTLKVQAPIMEQVKQVAPQAYQAMVGLTQSVVAMARELAPAQPAQGAPMSKSERLAKIEPDGYYSTYITHEGHLENNSGQDYGHDNTILNHWPHLQPQDTDEDDGGALVHSPDLVHRIRNSGWIGVDHGVGYKNVPIQNLDAAHHIITDKNHPAAKAARAYAKQNWVHPSFELASDKGVGKFSTKHFVNGGNLVPFDPVRHDPMYKAEGKDKAQKTVDQIRSVMATDLGEPKGAEHCAKGHCYVASEALYHLLGGKEAGWDPHSITHEGGPHWFLKHRGGRVLDPTSDQFNTPIPYGNGKPSRFLTDMPSDKTRQLVDKLLGEGQIKPKQAAEIQGEPVEKGGLPMPGASAHHHVVLPVGSTIGTTPAGAAGTALASTKIKTQHSDGTSGWHQATAGQIMAQDRDGVGGGVAGHAVSSREPNAK
jgi:hypothetical protein